MENWLFEIQPFQATNTQSPASNLLKSTEELKIHYMFIIFFIHEMMMYNMVFE